MPKLLTGIPCYRRHSQRNLGFIEVNGRRTYFPGKYKSAESRQAYRRFLAEWEINSRQAPPPPEAEITVTELVARFWKWACGYYVKNGRSTGGAENMKPTLTLLKESYGHTRAVDFGPLALKAMMERFVQHGLSRRGVNDGMHRIRKIFKWAASEQILPEGIYRALGTVEGLRKGRSEARESIPVMPVSEAMVDATLPFLPAIVRDMVQLQRLTGTRSGEIVQMRPADIDRTGPIWRFIPLEHKTEHHGKQRVICIGPKAQEILRPYLLRDAESNCFQPSESVEHQRRKRTLARKTPLSCGNTVGSRAKRNRRHPVGDQYTNDSYRRAITRACEMAFGMPDELRLMPAKGKVTVEERERLQKLACEWRAKNTWHPHQLRHSAATEVRQRFGLEAAQMHLGHSRADVTQVYTARNLELAERVALEVG